MKRSVSMSSVVEPVTNLKRSDRRRQPVTRFGYEVAPMEGVEEQTDLDETSITDTTYDPTSSQEKKARKRNHSQPKE